MRLVSVRTLCGVLLTALLLTLALLLYRLPTFAPQDQPFLSRFTEVDEVEEGADQVMYDWKRTWKFNTDFQNVIGPPQDFIEVRKIKTEPHNNNRSDNPRQLIFTNSTGRTGSPSLHTPQVLKKRALTFSSSSVSTKLE